MTDKEEIARLNQVIMQLTSVSMTEEINNLRQQVAKNEQFFMRITEKEKNIEKQREELKVKMAELAAEREQSDKRITELEERIESQKVEMKEKNDKIGVEIKKFEESEEQMGLLTAAVKRNEGKIRKLEEQLDESKKILDTSTADQKTLDKKLKEHIQAAKNLSDANEGYVTEIEDLNEKNL